MSGGTRDPQVRGRHRRPARIPHEPGLDGLRGVAVLLVLLFHGGLGVVGGALGVDVFLVLSGFLITALLLAELASTGTIDLRAFWGRRVRRLVPAALALVAVVAVHAAVTGEVSPDLRLDALATLGWWSNWHYAAAEVGYFESFGPPSPLRHTWSLGVEEQWYLAWPLLVLGAGWIGLRRRGMLAGIVALAAASVAAMWHLAGDVDRAHFGTDTRAQALLAGAAVAVLLHHRPTATWARWTRAATAVAGVASGAVVLALAWRLPGGDERLYRGGHLLVAVCTAAVVAAAVLPGGPVRAALSLRPLRAVGRVSYGLYLWHWPIFVWLNPDVVGLDRWGTFAVRAAVTTGATLLSWRLLERPILERRVALPRPRLVLATGYACVLALAAAAIGTDGGGSGGLTAAQPTLPAAYVAERQAAGAGSDGDRGGDAGEDVARRGEAAAGGSSAGGSADGAGGRARTAGVARAEPSVLDTPPLPSGRTGDPVVTVVGDSMGWALGWRVEPVEGVEVVDGGVVGCGVHPAAMVINGRPQKQSGVPVPCEDALDFWRWWVTDSDPELVVLTLGAWEVYDRVLDDGTRLRVGTERWRRWLAAELEAAATVLAEAAPHALLAVTDVPCFAERDPLLGGPASARNDPERVAAVNEVLDELVAVHPQRVVSLRWSQWLCGPGAFERQDGVHLTEPAAHDLWAGPLGEHVRGVVAQLRAGVATAEPASHETGGPAPAGRPLLGRVR